MLMLSVTELLFSLAATYTGGEVDPEGVFANNELDMSEIDIFGKTL